MPPLRDRREAVTPLEVGLPGDERLAGPLGVLDADQPNLARFVFIERMRTQPGLPGRTGVERWDHPDVGELRLAFETLELPDADEQRLLVYLPADEAASAALDQLTGRRSGALRVVTA